MRTPKRSRPIWLAGRTILVGLVAAGGLMAARVSAQEFELAGSFDFSARADTLSIEVVDRSFPFVPAGQVAFLTPSSAQASATSVSGTSAWAGGPYAGDLFTVLLGTVNGLAAGGLPPLPSTLPGYVISSSVDPTPDPLELGPYYVSARSEPRRSEARARLGVASQDPSLLASDARAEVDVAEDGSVRLTAEARITPFSLGSLVRIGEVNAVARMGIASDGTVEEKSTTTTMGSVSIGDLTIGFDDKGLSFLGSTLFPIDASVVNLLLKPFGVEFEYVAASINDTAVTSAGLRISMTQDVPTQGPVTVTFVLGQVSVAASTQFATDAGDSEALPVDLGQGLDVPVSTGSDDFGLPDLGLPGAGPVGPAGPVNTGQLLAETPIGVLRVGPDLLDFYLILLLGGFGCVATSRIVGHFAVRRPGGG